jgi:hypothetical protein
MTRNRSGEVISGTDVRDGNERSDDWNDEDPTCRRQPVGRWTEAGHDLAWHLSQKERYAAGKALRKACPRESHAVWKAPSNRRDPVEMVLAAEKGRLPELLPLRAALSGYMGKSEVFDEAISTFSVAYADQTEKDHAALERAVRRKQVKAVFEEDR